MEPLIKNSAREFLNRIEVNISCKTQPALIKNILKNLQLQRFKTSDLAFLQFFTKIQHEPIDMRGFITHLRDALLNNDCICQVLAYIQDNQLISDPELKMCSENLQVQVNMLCLFEAFVVSAANSEILASEIYEHIIRRRNNKYFPGEPISNFLFGAPKSASIFERLKIVSVEPAMLSLMFHRSTQDKLETEEDVLDFVRLYELSGWNSEMINQIKLNKKTDSAVPSMGLNILEAAWEDAKNKSAEINGSKENAMTALGLIKLMEENKYASRYTERYTILPEGMDDKYTLLPGLSIMHNKKKVGQFYVDSHWHQLYSSWNLCFVLNNLEAMFLPLKLLLPSTLTSSPENYKEVRVISLFLFANLYLNENVSQNPFFTSHVRFKNADQIMKRWGEVNKDYAEKLINKQCSDVSMSLEDIFNQVFGTHVTTNFFN